MYCYIDDDIDGSYFDEARTTGSASTPAPPPQRLKRRKSAINPVPKALELDGASFNGEASADLWLLLVASNPAMSGSGAGIM